MSDRFYSLHCIVRHEMLAGTYPYRVLSPRLVYWFLSQLANEENQ